MVVYTNVVMFSHRFNSILLLFSCSLYHAVAAASTALLAQANAFYQQTQLAAKQPAAVTPIVLASPMPTHVNMHASQQMAEYTTHQVNSMREVYAPCCVVTKLAYI